MDAPTNAPPPPPSPLPPLPPNAPPPAPIPAVAAVKRTGHSCIVMFVVFAITALSFGAKPMTQIVRANFNSVNFNLGSCLGVIGGILALVFLPVRLKAILKTKKAYMVLGLIGSIGLIAHLAVVAIGYLPGDGATPAAGVPRTVGAGGRRPLGWMGKEQWTINGRTYPIEATYHLPMNGALQYTIEYPHRFNAADWPMDDTGALAVVWPVIRHAYEQQLYQRVPVTKFGSSRSGPASIGVALFERTRGYRISLTMEQIKQRIQDEGE